MPRMTIDTSEAQSFEATEPGAYPMTVASAEAKMSKDNKPMLLVEYEFEDPAIAQRCGKVMRNYMLAGKGAGFTRELIKALTGEEIPVGGTFDFNSDDLVGKHVVAQIKNREYEGRLQNEVESLVLA